MKSSINRLFSLLSPNSNKSIHFFRYAFFFSFLAFKLNSMPTSFLHSIPFRFLIPSAPLIPAYRRASFLFKTHSSFTFFSNQKPKNSHRSSPYHFLSYDISSIQRPTTKSFKSLIQSLKFQYKNFKK